MRQRHREWVITFLAAALFGIGLVVAGMTLPSKVTGFLDLFGHWEATLMFVMIGGIAVHAFSHFVFRQQTRTWLGGALALPSLRTLDWRLLGGAAIFGIGWGLSGFCPGPGLVSAAAGSVDALLFVAAMIVGMVIHRVAFARCDNVACVAVKVDASVGRGDG